MELLLQKNQNFLFGKKIFFSQKKSIKKLVGALNNKKIAIVSGMRYSGKTKFLLDTLVKTQAEKSVFYYNSEVDTLGKIHNTRDLQTLLGLYTRIHGEPKIIILQNIGKIQGIKEYIGQLYTEKKYKIIIVGNNIKIGGVEEIIISPLTLEKVGSQQAQNFLKYGGIEEVQLVRDLYFKNFLLRSITENIIAQDVVHTYDIKNSYLYKQVISFIAKIDNNISLRELQRELEADGISIALMTLTDYVEASLKSKILKKMSKYDLKTGKEIPTKLKYYFSDTGVRNTLLGNIENTPLSLENTLLTELEKKGYSLHTGINGRFEFTCIAQKSEKNLCVHIHNGADKNELKKDVRKLSKIGGDSEKYILVPDISIYSLRKYKIDDVQIVELGELSEII